MSQQQKKEKDCDGVHWNYEGDTGPDNWVNLCAGFLSCGGQAQSPIDISTRNAVVSADLTPLEFQYTTSKTWILNTGHSIQFNTDGQNNLKVKGKLYRLLQFHFHHPSEHTIDGNHFPSEIHFVHKYSDTDFLVLGVMIVEGKENPFFGKYLDKFPEDKGTVYRTDEIFDLQSLLPGNKSYFYYKGSLTTPPCSEIVSWYVLKFPIEASKAQINKLAKLLKNNARPVLPLNSRIIKTWKE